METIETTNMNIVHVASDEELQSLGALISNLLGKKEELEAMNLIAKDMAKEIDRLEKALNIKPQNKQKGLVEWLQNIFNKLVNFFSF